MKLKKSFSHRCTRMNTDEIKTDPYLPFISVLIRVHLWLIAFVFMPAHAETFNAKVIAVMDGDTVLILRAGHKPEKLRMLNIDAPEKNQPYGRQSQQTLASLVLKRQAEVQVTAHDQYGRLLGQISVDGRNINEEQVKQGMAWEYSGYHSNKAYVALQSEAQQARRGLWAQTSPQAPWQWRKLHPLVKPTITSQSVTGQRSTPVMLYDMECGRKRRCSEMISCDEAHFYLTRCGVKVLDGNRDGEPCESLCGGLNK